MIETIKTPRGFVVGSFIDAYGVACSIQESSSVEPHLWLGCNDPNAKIFPGNNTGWHEYPLPPNVSCTTRMHINQEQAAALIPLLQHFVQTGQLPCEEQP